MGIFGPSTRSIVLIMTEEFVVDPGSFRWERRSPLVIRNWCIPVKNTLGWSTVAFCAYEIIQLFAVVFDVVRYANKLHLRVVTNETHHNWRPVESKPHSDKRLMFWKGLLCPPLPTVVASATNSTHTVQVNCIPLRKRKLLHKCPISVLTAFSKETRIVYVI